MLSQLDFGRYLYVLHGHTDVTSDSIAACQFKHHAYILWFSVKY